MPRADGPFEVPEKVNDNAYKIDLPGDYEASCTFNITGIKSYFEDDKLENLRKNSFLEVEDDEHMEEQHDQPKESPTSQEINSTRLLIQDLLPGLLSSWKLEIMQLSQLIS